MVLVTVWEWWSFSWRLFSLNHLTSNRYFMHTPHSLHTHNLLCVHIYTHTYKPFRAVHWAQGFAHTFLTSPSLFICSSLSHFIGFNKRSSSKLSHASPCFSQTWLLKYVFGKHHFLAWGSHEHQQSEAMLVTEEAEENSGRNITLHGCILVPFRLCFHEEVLQSWLEVMLEAFQEDPMHCSWVCSSFACVFLCVYVHCGPSMWTPEVNFKCRFYLGFLFFVVVLELWSPRDPDLLIWQTGWPVSPGNLPVPVSTARTLQVYPTVPGSLCGLWDWI